MNNKIKVVHMGYMHKFSDTRIFEKECKSLQKIDNIDITYITSDRNGSFDKAELDGIKIKTIPLIKKRFIKLAVYIRDLKKLCMELDADVYHIHEHVLLPMVKFLKRKGKKVIYDKHEETFDEVYSRVKKIFNEKLSRTIANKYVKYEKDCINKSDGYIYVTPQHSIEDINTQSILIPNFPKIKGTTFIDRKLSEDEKTKVAYCGGIAPIWSLKEFSNIIKNNEKYTLVMAGGGNSQYIDDIKEGSNNIDYRGIIKFQEVAEIYDNADIGIALLKKNLGELLNEEGTLANTKIFEYMQRGLPVIFSDFPIWKKINEKYNFGIPVNLEKEEEIMQALEFLYNNKEIALNMGKAGQKAILEEYNWEKTEKEFLNLYKNIIGDKNE